MNSTLIVILCSLSILAFGCAPSPSEKTGSKAESQAIGAWRNGAALLEQLPPGVEMTKIEDAGQSVTYHFLVKTPEQWQGLQRLSQRKARPSSEHFLVVTDGAEFRL